MTTPMAAAAYSDCEEEMLNQEEGRQAVELNMLWEAAQGIDASALSHGRSTCSRRTGIVAATCLGVLGLVGVLSLARPGRASGGLTSTKHLGSRMNLDSSSPSSLDFYSSAVPGLAAGEHDVDDTNPVIPQENMHDGNTCRDDEELFTGLCYRKCNLLAPGFPKRTSAWTCCREPCTWNGWSHDFGVCSGYSVAGSDGKSCPHKPGSCLENEEMLLGECFEKCSILTNGEYPHRVAAATCCKSDGVLCLDPFNDRTSSEFDVGGGDGDGDPSTPASAHAPMTSLTEADP